MSLAGRTALVTGGATGIGRAIALRLAAAGANIIINYPNEAMAAAAAEAEQLCRAGGSEAVSLMADITDYAATEAMFDQAAKQFGGLDIVVNNAGITRDNLLPRLSEADFDAVINVNLKGAFNCIKLAFAPLRKSNAGRIINIASVVAIHGNIGQANYTAAKAGLIGLTKTAAREYARKGITVNAIAPGFIATAMTAELSAEVRESMMQQTPLNRPGSPEDVAAAALFLASDDAAFITGHVLCVDGGMAM